MERKTTLIRNEAFKPIWSWRKRYVVLKGAAGSGKSRALAQYIFWQMIRLTPLKVLVMMKNATGIRDAAYAEIKGVIEDMGYADSFEFTVSPFKIVFKDNGNEVIFRGLDDPDKLKSISNINIIWLEEADRFDREDYEQADTRLRGILEHGHRMLISFNPTSDQSWLKERFFDSEDPEALVIETTYRDNRFLSPNYVDMFKHFSEAYKRVYLFGEWGRTSVDGMFYQKFDATKHTTTDELYDPELPLIYSMDFNVRPHCTALVAQLVDDDTLHIIDEIAQPGLNTSATTKEFIKRYREHPSGIMITGDPAGKHEDTRSESGWNDFKIVEQELREYRPLNKVPSVAPAQVPRGHFINDIFEVEHAGLRIMISKRCKKLINDLEYQPQTSDGKKDKSKVRDKTTGMSYEKYGHASDAFDMIIATVWKQQLAEHGKPKRQVDYLIGRNVPTRKYGF